MKNICTTSFGLCQMAGIRQCKTIPSLYFSHFRWDVSAKKFFSKKNKPPNLGEHCIEVRFEEQGKPNWHDEQWCAKILKICFTYILLFSYFTLTLISRSLGFGRSYHKIAPLCQTTANMAFGILFIFVIFGGKLRVSFDHSSQWRGF